VKAKCIITSFRVIQSLYFHMILGTAQQISDSVTSIEELQYSPVSSFCDYWSARQSPYIPHAIINFQSSPTSNLFQEHILETTPGFLKGW